MLKIKVFSPGTPLIALLAVFFAKGLFLAALFPVFQGPDEQTHYATIQNYTYPLTDTRGLSHTLIYEENNINTRSFSEEMKGTARVTNFDFVRFDRFNTQTFSDGVDGVEEDRVTQMIWDRQPTGSSIRFAQGQELYYIIAAKIESALSSVDILTRLFALRIFSVFLGTMIILLAFQTTRVMGFSRNSALLIAALVAFHPMFSFMSAVISSDVLLFFTFALFTCGALSLFATHPIWKNVTAAIAGAFLGFVTKGPGIVLIVAGILLLAYLIGSAHGLWKNKRRIAIVTALCLLCVSFLFISSPVRDYAAKITRSSETSLFASPIASFSAYAEKTIGYDKFLNTTQSYWGNFGWLDTPLPEGIVMIIFWLEVLLFIGACAYLFSRSQTIPNAPPRHVVLFLILLVIALQCAIRFYDWRVFDAMDAILIGQPGRYFMPNIVAHTLLLVAGLGYVLHVIKKSQWFVPTLKLGVLLMILLQLYAIFALIIPRYYL